MVVMEFPHEGSLFDDIPLSAVPPGEDLDKRLFFRAVPYLRHHRIAAAVLQGLYPEVAVEQHKSPRYDHGDDLAHPFDGSGQGKTLLGPLDSRVGVPEVELSYLDLPDFPMSFHI